MFRKSEKENLKNKTVWIACSSPYYPSSSPQKKKNKQPQTLPTKQNKEMSSQGSMNKPMSSQEKEQSSSL